MSERYCNAMQNYRGQSLVHDMNGQVQTGEEKNKTKKSLL